MQQYRHSNPSSHFYSVMIGLLILIFLIGGILKNQAASTHIVQPAPSAQALSDQNVINRMKAQKKLSEKIRDENCPTDPRSYACIEAVKSVARYNGILSKK